MQQRLGLNRFSRLALLTLAALALMGALAAASAQANGTIVAKKGGDRTSSSRDSRYADGVAGATFEYTQSESKAADPDSTGWTAFPSPTGSNGEASASVPEGTYYVRERGAGSGGFGDYGAVHSLHFNPDGGTAPDAQPYVAKLRVHDGETTNAYPHDDYDRDDPGDTDDWEPYNKSDWDLFDGWGPNDLTPFINVRDNGDAPLTCGTNILLVLDRSGSIGGHERDYEAAAKQFVSSLDGTPTQIGIISFAENVSDYNDNGGHAPLDLNDPGSADELDDTIEDVYDDVGGGTNWDAALQEAADANGFTANNATGQTTNADEVVFITDGNPTYNDTDEDGNGSDVDLRNLTAGMASANLVKDQPSRPGTSTPTVKMFAIGVGSGVTAENLKVVSGPTEGVSGDYATPSIPELEAFLTELASTTCGARINVRKHLADDPSHANQSNWSYSGSRSDNGTIGYLDGNQKTHSTGDPPTVETAVLAPNVPAGGTTLTVTEDPYSVQPQSGYSQLDSVQCATGGYDGTPIQGNPSGRGISFNVTRGEQIYCTYTNSKPRTNIKVVKHLAPASDGGKFDLEVGSDTVASAVGNNGSGDKDVTPGTYTVSEAGANGTDLSDYSSKYACTIDGQSGPSGSGTSVDVTADPGDNVVCTFTNTRKAKITVVKDLKPASDPGLFDLKVGGQTVKSNATDGGSGSRLVDPGTYSVSEAGGTGTSLSNYSSSIACDNNASGQGTSLDVQVGAGDDVTCTITNTRAKANIEVVKDLVPSSDSGKFNLKVGDDVVASNVGDGGSGDEDVAPGSYDVSETAGTGTDLADYSSSISCVVNNGNPTQGGHVTVDSNDHAVCTITNTRKPPEVALTKTTSTPTISAGDVAKFEVKLVNNGTGTARNVTVNDVLPTPVADPGWQFDGPAPIGCTIADGTGPDAGHQVLSCSGLTLAPHGQPNDSLTIDLKAATPSKQCAELDNTVSATVGNGDNPPDATAKVDCENPGLSVVKTAVNGTINAGDDAEFSIVVSNTGAGTAKSVKLDDPLPSGTSGPWQITNQPSGNPCEINGTAGNQTLSCDFGDLAPKGSPGDSATVKVSAPTDATHCKTYDNTATATASNADKAQDDAKIDCLTPDLTVRKSGNGPIDAGDTAEFSITLINGGAGVAKGASLDDPLPAGLDWSIASQPSGNPCQITGAAGSQTLSCDFGDLGSQQSRTVEVSAKTSFEQCSTYENTATGDADNAGKVAAHATIECNKPDLTVDKTAASGTVSAGDPLQFSIKVSNDGDGEAKDVTLSDPLPLGTDGGWSIVSAPASWSCEITPASPTSDQQTLSCDSIGVLDKGDSGTVVVKADTSAQDCTTYDNTATASASNSPDRSDKATIECNKPGLAVVKTAVNGTINAGDDAEFSIVVSNTGTGTAKSVKLDDPLPSGTSGPWQIADQPSGNPCEITGAAGSQTLSCDFGDLEPAGSPGDSATVKVTAPTDPDHCTTYDNTATATASNADKAQGSATIDCQRAKITVVKQLEPTNDDGHFDLRVDQDTVKAHAGDGDSGSEFVAPGPHTVSEVADGGPGLSKYDTSIACDNQASGKGSSLKIDLAAGADVTCTITNVRHKGHITVVKRLVPKTDPGRFDLRVDDDVVKAAAGDGDKGSAAVDPGTYTVSEAGAAGTSLAKYGSAITCTVNGKPGPHGAGTSLAGVKVDSDDEVICTITNMRKPTPPPPPSTGTITVVKRLSPAGDPGRFDLSVDGKVVKAGAGNGGQGSAIVGAGVHTVSEAGASLGDYNALIACTVNGGPGPKFAGTALRIRIAGGDRAVCTITNTRKPTPPPPPPPSTGTLTVVKQLKPSNDRGRFDLKVDGKVVKKGARDGGRGTATVKAGNHRVSESGAGATKLGRYRKSISCTLDGKRVERGKGGHLKGVHVGAGDHVICTITNKRKRRITHGRARLHGPGPRQCVKRAFRVRVTGSKIAAVRFFLDGKRIKTIHARRHHRLSVRIKAKQLRKHRASRIVAKVRFRKGTRPRHRTLKLRVHRCEPKPPQPHFTG